MPPPFIGGGSRHAGPSRITRTDTPILHTGTAMPSAGGARTQTRTRKRKRVKRASVTGGGGGGGIRGGGGGGGGAAASSRGPMSMTRNQRRTSRIRRLSSGSTTNTGNLVQTIALAPITTTSAADADAVARPPLGEGPDLDQVMEGEKHQLEVTLFPELEVCRASSSSNPQVHLQLESQVKQMTLLLNASVEADTENERALTCPICLELLYQPFLLQGCGHVFCYSCLKNWMTMSKSHDDTVGRLTHNLHRKGNKICPSCREKVHAPPTCVWLIKELVANLVRKQSVDPLNTLHAENLLKMEQSSLQVRDKSTQDLWPGLFPGSVRQGIIHDIADGVRRCPGCGYEIIHGRCDICQDTFSSESDSDFEDLSIDDDYELMAIERQTIVDELRGMQSQDQNGSGDALWAQNGGASDVEGQSEDSESTSEDSDLSEDESSDSYESSFIDDDPVPSDDESSDSDHAGRPPLNSSMSMVSATRPRRPTIPNAATSQEELWGTRTTRAGQLRTSPQIRPHARLSNLDNFQMDQDDNDRSDYVRALQAVQADVAAFTAASARAQDSGGPSLRERRRSTRRSIRSLNTFASRLGLPRYNEAHLSDQSDEEDSETDYDYHDAQGLSDAHWSSYDSDENDLLEEQDSDEWSSEASDKGQGDISPAVAPSSSSRHRSSRVIITDSEDD